MKNSINKNLKEECQLFMLDDDLAHESVIYNEISSEAFKSEISFVMADLIKGTNLDADFYYWEENDAIGRFE